MLFLSHFCKMSLNVNPEERLKAALQLHCPAFCSETHFIIQIFCSFPSAGDTCMTRKGRPNNTVNAGSLEKRKSSFKEENWRKS